ncbi:hypothetical protein MHC_05630 [Mycoplasma haemocanis str. Illinois]|uniref:Uncharacterized protein n=1 Tax=Mycoplasma haemocanis (strain Illinois) TaxID=1111676 RepID=H6N8K8_MYCHN|nr:hypothetical protein [Mycoplasma haemocanis]AEW45980.1 hypothetical protein MHC_05630 [Mycoplasma haemocanis str. Illinois]
MFLQVFHSKEAVVLALHSEDKCLDFRTVEKVRIGERFLESLENLYFSHNVWVDRIYFRNSYSSWNASRLLVVCLKVFISFGKFKIYLKEEELDVDDIHKEIRNFNKEEFKLLRGSEDLSPLYKKCPTINI